MTDIRIQPATLNDMRAMWSWHEDARHFRLCPPGGVAIERHHAWFKSAIADPAEMLLVASTNTLRVGMVWFSRTGPGQWRAAIMVKPGYLARGLGMRIWQAGEAAFRADPAHAGDRVAPEPALAALIAHGTSA